MIASPCKHCRNVHAPKDECIQDCPLIQEIQKIAAQEFFPPWGAINCTEESRYFVSSPFKVSRHLS